jgi:hypothetical protein
LALIVGINVGGYFLSAMTALYFNKNVDYDHPPEDAKLNRIWLSLILNLAAMSNAPILFINRRVDFLNISLAVFYAN